MKKYPLLTALAVAIFLTGLLAGFLAGCPASKSSRCKKLCQRQIECIEAQGNTEVIIDENECTSACSVLERDSEGKKRADAYAHCVDQAGEDCAAVLACQ